MIPLLLFSMFSFTVRSALLAIAASAAFVNAAPSISLKITGVFIA